MSRVLVLGGGVIGAACAYYLNRADWEVEVVDQGAFGRGASHANCGIVCPSHALPLAEPGTLWPTLKSLLQKNSPFIIKPRLDLDLLDWLARFAVRCNHHDMLRAGRAIVALLQSSRALWDQLLRTEPLDCEWETRGLLYAYRTRAAFEAYAHTDQLLRAEFGLPARSFEGDDVCAFEPALQTGLAGGWLYEGDAHLRPDRLLAGLRRVLAARGVAIREQCAVRDFVSERGSATAVLTVEGERLTADAFVVATGAWTPLLNGALGCRLLIQPGKGYSLTMPRPARCPSVPMILVESRVAVTPMQSGYRLGSTMEFTGYDATLNRARLQLLRDGAAQYLVEPTTEPVQEEWFGWRPMTPDSVPYIGFSPKLPNVLIAAGHNMLGVSMSPATGRLVAELLDGTTPHLDPEPYGLRGR